MIDTIEAELLAVQGEPAPLGGYYQSPWDRLDAIMRPSETWNTALAALGA
jgi:isocitrate dehydrogenase